MAGTLLAALLTVVCCSTVGSALNSQGSTCIFMDHCSDDFNIKARQIGHDQEAYCELRRQELQCFQSALQSCPREQRDFAQKQLQNAQNDQDEVCGAVSTMSSFLVVSVASAVALLYSCLL